MGMKLIGRYAERIRGIEGEALEKLVLMNVRKLFSKAAELTPVVIVVEDLHWADTSSVELLESLFRLTETQRILFINVFRPGYKESGERIVESIKDALSVYYVDIVLEPLNEQTSEALIINMLKSNRIHHAVIGKIIQRTGGNPYFIEEVVQSFIDEGALILKDGSFKVTEKIKTMSIPHTINDVLMARIDRLEEKTRTLVKIASVIGRSFFYRILAEVLGTDEDLDDRLSYLKEIQFIQERRRMEELEYFFKHDLAQEIAYESILSHKRKELHLRVARSIEKIFNDRLYEFFGMLAFHFSKGENLDKAEEYMIKAGEDALKSSASSEALHFYKEAFSIYQEKYGNTVDPEKVVMFEKNIALALFNRGQYVEAVEYFNKAINYYWGILPKHAISEVLTFLSAFFHYIISLYLPSLKFKKIPTQRDNEVADLCYKKCEALVIIDPKRFVFESFYFLKKAVNFDLTKLHFGVGLFASASSLFSFTGLSFKLSRKILDSAKDKVDKNDMRQLILCDLLETAHNFYEGNWKTIQEYDDDLVRENLSMGNIWDVAQHLYWHGFTYICQGYLDRARSMINKLNEIGEVYHNDNSMLFKYLLNTNLLTECREFHDAMIETEKAIDFVQRSDSNVSLINMYAYKALLNLLTGDANEAERSLKDAYRIISEGYVFPLFSSNFYRTQFEYYLYRLEESLKSGTKSGSFEHRSKAIKSGKRLVKISQKAARHRTESYKLMGVYYWLIGKQKKAVKWWNKSINEGRNADARLGLSRTYFQVGKRLLEAQSEYETLNGIGAEGYLEKARVLFKEMNLQWDLDELEKVTGR